VAYVLLYEEREGGIEGRMRTVDRVKNKRNEMVAAGFAFLLALSGCTTSQEVSGPLQASIIQSTGHCTYAVQPTQLNTVRTLNPLSGKLGTVVKSDGVFDYDSNPEKFENFQGLFPLETFFTKRSSKIYPLDYPSLAAISIYGFMDQVYSLFSNTDPGADLLGLVPDSADTKIVYQAKRYLDPGVSEEVETDNASYYYIPMTGGGARNYLMVFPASDVVVPLGLNPFVVAHETTHFENRHLWRKKLNITTQSTLNVVGSLDEGFADYVGFLVTKDPGGFLCSFPEESVRDLGQWKTIASLKAKVSTKSQPRFELSSENYVIHYAGAVFAAANYRIGGIVGHEVNFQALVKTFKNLSACGDANSLNFTSFAACHVRNLPRGQSQASQIYSEAFSGSGG